MDDITPTAATTIAVGSLSDRINAAHAASLAMANNALDHAMRCGDLLAEAKAVCGHGHWAEWVAKNCTFSLRTAQQYLRMSKNRPVIEASNAHRGAHLPVCEAQKLIAGPSRSKRSKGLTGDGLPDLSAQLYGCLGRVGLHVAAVQIEQSGQTPGYWYVETLDLVTLESSLLKRPCKLAVHDDVEQFASRGFVTIDPTTYMISESRPFLRTDSWGIFTREEPLIELIDERVRERAWLITDVQMRAKSFGEALEIAKRELSSETLLAQETAPGSE
jgi:hypothetical protein